MPLKTKQLLVTLLFFCSTLLSTQLKSADFEPSEAGFNSWLNDFKQKAKNRGISETTLEQAFKDITFSRDVVKSDRKQPEFTQTFFQYFDRAVSKYRIKNGQKYYKKHKKLLDEVTQKYGIPGRYLVAFWGMETNYGSYTGNLPIIQSLATLAYDPRRSKFFTNELLSALTILDKGHVNLEQMKGSWAGAMGQCQFMPSNYLRYAVDGDGDGKINLWDSLPDVFHSAGNFLNQLGWQTTENWGREVILPKNFNYSLADNKTARPLKYWDDLGITLAGAKKLPHANMNARLLLVANYKGPAFLVYENFRVIKRWNNSDKYAIAVGHLADQIIHRPALSKSAPKNDKSLSRTQIKELQTYLNLLGYTTGKPDGIAGSQTRKALRAFQAKRDLPADGFPNLEILNILKKAIDGNIKIDS